MSFIKVGFLIKYSSHKNIFGKIRPVLDTKNDFENHYYDIFDKVVHNFGKFDDVII